MICFLFSKQTNHIGHFHLSTLLLPKLKEGQPSRVVCLSSSAHKFGEDEKFNSENEVIGNRNLIAWLFWFRSSAF